MRSMPVCDRTTRYMGVNLRTRVTSCDCVCLCLGQRNTGSFWLAPRGSL